MSFIGFNKNFNRFVGFFGIFDGFSMDSFGFFRIFWGFSMDFQCDKNIIGVESVKLDCCSIPL